MFDEQILPFGKMLSVWRAKSRSSHRDSFRKYLFFFSRSNLYRIFQEGLYVLRKRHDFPGGFIEKIMFFQGESICSSNRPYYLIEQILIFPKTLI